MPDSDPFQTLGLPPSFDLDPKSVERAYLARVASVHPDLESGSPDDEVLSEAAELNRARQALLNPESRALALLRILGHAGEDRSLPEGFLLEIMDVRMDLEEAAASGNAERVGHWRSWAAERRLEWTSRIAELFLQHSASPNPELLSEVRRSLNAWRYIERMLEQIGPESGPSR